MADYPIHLPAKRILSPGLSGLLGAAVFALAIFGSFLLERDFSLEKRRIFYLPPADYLIKASGTFRSFLADIFYIRGILELSEEIKDRAFWADWVQKNFELATTLDPQLTQGYFFAGVVIASNKEFIQKGVQFLEKALSRNSQSWEIPYWLGFNYFQLGEFLKAAEYYQKAAKFNDAPLFLKSNPAVFYYRAKRPDLGIIYLEGLSRSIKDPRQLEWIEIKLGWLKNIALLEDKIGQYKMLYGAPPESLEKLVAAGLLKDIPADPFGSGYYLDRNSGAVKNKI